MEPTTPPAYTYQSDATRSFTTPQDFYRLRDFGQKFEAAIAFIRKHGRNMYRVLLLPALLAVVPLVLFVVVMFSMGYYRSGFFGPTFNDSISQDNGVGFMLAMVPAMLIMIVFLLFALMVVYAMLFGFVKLRMYQPDATTPITTAQVWQESKRYVLPLLGYSLVAGIITLVASFFLMIPGIYVAIVFQLLPAVVLFEDAGLGQTISRCFSLISGKWWSTFGLLFVGSLLVGVIGMIIGVVFTLLALPFSLTGNTTAALIGVGISTILRLIINFLLYPFIYLLLLFQYFNLVERRDHVSLQWQAEQLGQTPGGPGSGPSPGLDDTLFRPSYGDQTL